MHFRVRRHKVSPLRGRHHRRIRFGGAGFGDVLSSAAAYIIPKFGELLSNPSTRETLTKLSSKAVDAGLDYAKKKLEDARTAPATGHVARPKRKVNTEEAFYKMQREGLRPHY